MAKTIRHDMVVIRAEVLSVPNETMGPVLEYWMEQLIKDQGMELIKGPAAAWVGEEGLVGFSCGALIKTSHAVVHVWNEPDPKIVELDFYTCGTLNVDKVIEALRPFKPQKVKYWVYNRDDDMILVDSGVKTVDAAGRWA